MPLIRNHLIVVLLPPLLLSPAERGKPPSESDVEEEQQKEEEGEVAMSQPGNPAGTSGPEAIDRDVRTLREVSRGSARSLSTGCDIFQLRHGSYGTYRTFFM